MSESTQEAPLSWAGALTGAAPFLVYGLIGVLAEAFKGPWLEWYLARYLLMLAGFVWGWVRGFPRWSWAYVGLVLVCTWHWMGIPAQNLWQYDVWILKEYNELLGWRAWIPLLVLAFAVLALTRSLRPFRQMVAGVRQDWTRLSFAWYGVIAFVADAGFDENNHPYLIAFMLASAAALTACALAYGRGVRASQRAWALLGGMLLSFGVIMIASAAYWGVPVQMLRKYWYRVVWRQVALIGMYAGILLVPGLPGLLWRFVKPSRTA